MKRAQLSGRRFMKRARLTAKPRCGNRSPITGLPCARPSGHGGAHRCDQQALLQWAEKLGLPIYLRKGRGGR